MCCKIGYVLEAQLWPCSRRYWTSTDECVIFATAKFSTVTDSLTSTRLGYRNEILSYRYGNLMSLEYPTSGTSIWKRSNDNFSGLVNFVMLAGHICKSPRNYLPWERFLHHWMGYISINRVHSLLIAVSDRNSWRDKMISELGAIVVHCGLGLLFYSWCFHTGVTWFPWSLFIERLVHHTLSVFHMRVIHWNCLLDPSYWLNW